jgi:NAD(P)H-dependent FMN reductase
MKSEADAKVGGEEHIQGIPKPSLRIAAVCGSLSPESKTKMALSLALKGASEFDVSTKLIELREYKLVFYGEVDKENYPLDVFRLRQELKESQGIILGTPEYHGSLSGALKNMLDLMSTEGIVNLTKIEG